MRDGLLVYVQRGQAHSSLWQRRWWDRVRDRGALLQTPLPFLCALQSSKLSWLQLLWFVTCVAVVHSQRTPLPASSWRCLWLNSDDASPTPCEEERETERSQQWVSDLSTRRLWHGVACHVILTWGAKLSIKMEGEKGHQGQVTQFSLSITVRTILLTHQNALTWRNYMIKACQCDMDWESNSIQIVADDDKKLRWKPTIIYSRRICGVYLTS